MAQIKLVNVSKYFKEKYSKEFVAALYKANVEIEDGKFTVILGASGSGKTVMLRTIAGLYTPDEGEIYFDGIEATHLAPAKRNISLLTQEYALYPHLTVFDNVAYPLKVGKVPAKEIKERVYETLKLLDLELLSSRKPKALSGGQQQRVAIARALVKQPDIILLDEPLSNVDNTKKIDLMNEFIKLHKKLQITFIYVTHNLGEATALADNIVIIENGEVIESGTKGELLNKKDSYLNKNFIKVGEIS